MQSQNLYFLAIIPHGKVAGEVTAFKEHIAQHYNSHKALRVMPHITLKAPFIIDAALHANVCSWFRQLHPSVSRFTQHIDGFGAFNNKNKPVLYVHPVVSEPLQVLQQQIIAGFAAAFPQSQLSFSDERFSPHMTIGYRDLSPEMFIPAWDEFRNRVYKADFEVASFYLLQHDTRQWNIIEEYILK